MKVFLSSSLKETKRIAKELAAVFLKRKNGCLVIALTGELGSGKTTFTQFFLKALGVRDKVVSPTFVLMRTYALPHRGYQRSHHFDLYRLKASKEIMKLGLRSAFKDHQAIVLIEWADRIKRFLPKNTVWITFKHGKKSNQRFITVKFP